MAPTRQELDVLSEAIREVNQEDGEKRKAEVKELVRKALSLQQQMNQAERQFNAEKAKFDKDLGKLLNRLQSFAKGEPDPVEEETPEQSGS